MVKRIKIGYHSGLNDYGLFISAPGQSVDDTTKPLMLDSRFKGMDLLTQGRVNMNRQTAGTGPNVETTYYVQVTIPDLGYFPLFYGAVYYISSNGLGLETNVEYWPSSGIYRRINTEVKFSGVWMPNRTTLNAQLNLRLENAGNAQFYYCVLKNNGNQSIGT
jgi:hypothetical protein